MDQQAIVISNLLYILLALSTIANYVFSALAFYKISSNEKVSKPWFAWIPILSDYLVIKLGCGKVWMLILSILSMTFSGPVAMYLSNGNFNIVATVILAIWLIYKVYMYSNIVDKYNVSLLYFIAGFALQLFTSMASFGMLVCLIGHILLFVKARKGIDDNVIIETKITFGNKKKKKTNK